MLSHKEKLRALNAFAIFQSTPDPVTLSKEGLSRAVSGVMVQKKTRDAASKQTLIQTLNKIDQTPFVHDDSTSAWMHVAVTKFGLNAGMIRAMKFGQTMKVLLMDRNVGEYVDDSTLVFDPAKQGFSYATYVHGQNLTGLLQFKDGVILAPFEWEVNVGALESTCYWGPLETGHHISDDILVGWRGPAIDMVHMSELPSAIGMYGTWWDDSGVTKYSDWKRKE